MTMTDDELQREIMRSCHEEVDIKDASKEKEIKKVLYSFDALFGKGKYIEE